ncbi:MAG: FAD-binding oxidoreductase [Roseiflexaceae bacterium]
MPSQRENALRSLAHLLTPGQVLTNPAELLTYEGDAGMDRGRPDGVACPRTAVEVERIVRWAAEHHVPLVARGAGTGLSGGAVAEHGGLIVQFSQMGRVLEFDAPGRSVVVEPGLVNQALDELVKTHGFYYPPDPSSGRASTIGGNIAENSGGPHCFKYGVTTNYVSGLQVVLADGRRVRLGGRALDYPEYDLVGLLIGSEGTLGIVTEASLRLIRNPPAVKTLMAAFESVEAAGEAVSALIARGLVPATLEMMDQKIMRIIEDFAHAGLPVEAGAALIVEVDGFPESVAPQIDEISTILIEHEARDLRVAQTAEQRDAIWYARKSAAGAMSRLAPAYYLVDVTVPRSKLAATLAGVNQICEEASLRVGYVFHAGDGNLHPLILIERPNDQALLDRVLAAGHKIVELCIAYDGSITGEHGVGIEKRDMMPLMYSDAELDAMREIKQVFDPANLLNPGKILPPVADDRRPTTDDRRPTTDDRRPTTDDHKPALYGGHGGVAPTADHGPQMTPDGSRFSVLGSGESAAVLRPSSADAAAEMLRACVAAGRSVRIRGGGTKSGGLPETDVLLSTERLCGIRTYARDDLYVTVGAGTPLDELLAELARDRMWAPLASPWPASTVGGIVATNWNAPLRMRYGGLRDLLLAATIALPDGRVIRAGRPVVKNVAGYDLPKLFVGAHGTLGLIADVTLKLAPLPRARATLVVPVGDLGRGLDWGARLLRVCLGASALLLCRDATIAALHGASAPYTLIYTAEGLPQDVAAELAEVQSGLTAAGAPAAIQIEISSGSDIWASWLGARGAEPTLRMGLAVKELPGILRSLAAGGGASLSFVADLASGLLYARGLADLAAAREAAQAAGGYAMILRTANTTDGALDDWGHVPEGLELMRELRRRWGAGGLLNPRAFVI